MKKKGKLTKVVVFNQNNQRLEVEIVEPKDAIAFDPEEFKILLLYACEVANGPDTALTSPNNVIVDGEKTPPTVHRVFTAMRSRFGKDTVKVQSLVHRYFAFLRLVASINELEGFIIKGEGNGFTITEPALEVLAFFPLDKEGSIDPKAFVVESRKRAGTD